MLLPLAGRRNLYTLHRIKVKSYYFHIFSQYHQGATSRATLFLAMKISAKRVLPPIMIRRWRRSCYRGLPPCLTLSLPPVRFIFTGWVGGSCAYLAVSCRLGAELLRVPWMNDMLLMHLKVQVILVWRWWRSISMTTMARRQIKVVSAPVFFMNWTDKIRFKRQFFHVYHLWYWLYYVFFDFLNCEGSLTFMRYQSVIDMWLCL